MVNAKGFSGIFIVQSIAPVPTVNKVKREHRNSADSGSKRKPGRNFSEFLTKASEENEEASLHFSTATYGRDSMIHFFTYQPKEYRY